MSEEGLFPITKAELLERIHNEWDALLAVVDSLAAERMLPPDRGGWSIKDNLAHITEWEKFLLRNQFEGKAAHEALGVDRTILETTGETTWNALLLKRNRNRELKSILAEWRQTHAQLLSVLEKMPEADLAKLTPGIGGETLPLIEWIRNNTCDHYAEHRATIVANLREQNPSREK